MFCPDCGAQCAEGTAFCNNCGAPLNTQTNAQPVWSDPAPQSWEQPAPQSWEQPAAQTWEQPAVQTWEQPAAQTWDQPVSNPLPTASKIMGIISFVCGIISLPSALAYGSGLVAAIAAVILGSIASRKAEEAGTTNPKAISGKKLGIVGIIVNAILGVIVWVIYFIYIFAIAAMSTGYSY